MNSLILITNVIGLAAATAALVAIVKGERRDLSAEPRALFAGLVLLCIISHLSNVLRWSGVTVALEGLEDYSQIIAPVLWCFFLSSTLQAKAARELRASESRYRGMTEAMPLAIYELNFEGMLTYVNQRGMEMLGYEIEDVERGLSGFDMLAPEDRERAMKTAGEAALDDTIGGREYTAVRKDGTTFPAMVHSRPLLADGIPIGILGILADVSTVRDAEEESRSANERYRSLMENISEGVYEVDLQGRIQLMNRALLEITGWPEETLYRVGYQDYVVDEDKPKVFGGFNEVFRTGKSKTGLTYGVEHQSGDVRLLESSISLRRDRDGKPVGFYGVLRDITENRRAEEEHAKLEAQLHHTQKMEAVGTLAGGIAHDFNNLLTGILGYSSLLKTQVGPGDKVYRAADVIERAAERAKNLTAQLLGFARKGKHQVVAVDVNVTITDVIALLDRTIDKNVQLTEKLSGKPAMAMGDPSQLEQVFLNLAVNARDAMPEGGWLSIEVKIEEADEEIDAPEGERKGEEAGGQVVVTVSDTGCGIPEAEYERIFEPFFSTKDPSKGSGMGLAMAYGIAENHGGSIEVTSVMGGGSCFTVRLPYARDAVAAVPIERRPLEAGQGRILLVDDEETVRETLSDVLMSMGYEVVTANDGMEAVDCYKRSKQGFDLAIIDMVMPRMGGGDCFRALKAMNPGIRAILCSGYGRDGAAQKILDEGMLDFLEKPFRSDELSNVLQKVLG